MSKTLENKSILLVISGGIAAYKSLELIRLIRKAGGNVRCILTKGGAQFITPLSVSSLSENETYTDLFSLKDETGMGHIRLSREADLIVVAPASANMIAKLANGIADDLASTALLAANKQILLAPAMNHMMWQNPATRENISRLLNRNFQIVGPVEGEMACGEFGLGRMSEPEEILSAIQKALSPPGRGLGEGEEIDSDFNTFAKRLRYARKSKNLSQEDLAKKLEVTQQAIEKVENGQIIKPKFLYEAAKVLGVSYEWLWEGTATPPHPSPLPKGERELEGLTAIVTSGPTFEPIDPVRFIGNRSSGKQGHAIAQALAESGAAVTLISGPVKENPPAGVKLIEIETAAEMLAAVEKNLPADIFIGAAAVSDWSAAPSAQKIKKQPGKTPALNLRENADILKTVANRKKRPGLVIGFAAETENLLENAKAKLKSKNCDWIIANNVSENLFGGDENQVYLITQSSADKWEKQGKRAIAQKLAAKIGEHFTNVRTIKEAAE